MQSDFWSCVGGTGRRRVFCRWLAQMVTPSSWLSLGKLPQEFGIGLAAAVVLFVCEWFNRRQEYGLAIYPRPAWSHWAIYLLLVVAIVFCAPVSHDFVYFQF